MTPVVGHSVSEMVHLDHGTTVDAAQVLALDGSRPPEIETLLLQVAERFEVPPADLRAAVRVSYAAVGHRRQDFAASLHPAHARLYAGRRGGEANHEIVTAAIRLRDPDLSLGEAEAQATDLVSEPAALVALDVPFEHVAADLPRPRRQREPWDSFSAWVEYAQQWTAVGRNLHISHVSAGWVSSIDPVEPVVHEPGLARHLPSTAHHLLRTSNQRPLSIGPVGDGIYELSAIHEWLAALEVAEQK